MISISEASRSGMPGSRISLAGWAGLGACLVSLTLTLQTLHGQIVDYDDGVYWQSLRAMARGHSLFGSVFSSQPPLFLLGLYPFYEILGQSLVAARLAVLLFSLLGLAGAYVTGRALGHPSIGAVACLLLSLDPLYEAGAHAVQAELPSIALQIWAVAFAALAMRATSGRRACLVVGAGVALGCALLTKLFAVAALAPIVLYLGAPLAARWSNDPGQRAWMSFENLRLIAPTLGLLAAGLFGAVVLALLPYAAELGTVDDQAVRFHLVAVQTGDHSLLGNLRIIVGALRGAPLVYIALLAAIVIAWQRVWAAVPLLVWVLSAFGLLALLHPLWQQHVVLLTPALAMIGGCGAAAAWQAFSRPCRGQRLGLAITLMVLMLAGGIDLALNRQQNADANRRLPLRSMRLVSALARVSTPDEYVLSDDQYVAALADRDLPPQLVDTSFVRISSGYLSAAQLEGLIARDRIRVILFATGRLDQVSGFHAWVSQNFTPVARFDNGGVLFVRAPGKHN